MSLTPGADDAAAFCGPPAESLPWALRQVVGYRLPARPGAVHRGLPSPYLTLVFSLAGPTAVHGFGPPGRPDHGRFRALVGGLHLRAVRLPQDARQAGVQVDVHPFAARALLGTPAGDLAGEVLEVADVLGRSAPTERICEARSPAAAVDLALGWVLGRLRNLEPEVPWQLRAGWAGLVGSAGRRSVAAVAAEVGWSRRHFTAEVRRATGLGPKDLARTARLQHAISLLHRGIALADVAHACGYADQPHLTSDFRDLVGCTPRHWQAEESGSHFSKTSEDLTPTMGA